MKNLKLSKSKFILLILVLILIIFAILFINNTKVINNLFGIDIKQEDEEILPLFSYVVYDNQDKENIKVLITVNSQEGIEYVEYPNGNKLNVSGKNKISIDYLAKENENYTFGIKELNKEKENKEIVINNDIIQEIEMKINKITDISGYKIIDIDRKIEMKNYGNVYYKIGENGNWIEGTKFSMLDYDLTQNELVNEDNTVTVFARITNDITKDVVIVNEKYNVDTTERIANMQSDSLLQVMNDNNFENGRYKVTVSDETYDMKVYNINGSVDMSVDTTIGVEEDVAASNKYAQNMIVLKVNGDLTIGENTTLTPYASTTGYGGPKGMMIYCTGTLTNNGTINMTARGAYAEGQNLYLFKNTNNTYEFVPAVGADGGLGVGARQNGRPGVNGKNRQTGGGGSGSAHVRGSSGAGAKGTSYSGGSSGAGSRNIDGLGDFWGNPGSENGGPGGNSRENKHNGVGNPSGGTGGLIVLYANNILNNSNIISEGTISAWAGSPGGSSGGGSINIFYKNNYNNVGNLSANGGAIRYGNLKNGGAGGNGCVSVGNISTGTYINTYNNYSENE